MAGDNIITKQDLFTLLYVKILQKRNIGLITPKDLAKVLKKLIEFVDQVEQRELINDDEASLLTTYSSVYIDQLFAELIPSPSSGPSVTYGILLDTDLPLFIDWETDLVPGETQTYKEKHGEIEKILVQFSTPNAIIPNCYTPVLTWGFIPPSIGIVPKLILDNQFQKAYYIISGKDVILITPAIPKDMVIDQASGEVTFTNSVDYATIDHEYTGDGGINYYPITSKPIITGGGFPEGTFGVRVKADLNQNRTHSATLYNEIAIQDQPNSGFPYSFPMDFDGTSGQSNILPVQLPFYFNS